MQLIHEVDGQWVAADETPPDWDSPGGLLLEVDAEPTEGDLNVQRIGINFPAFNDGRGLSLAVLLRTRLKFGGDLYAVGAVHQDILHYMIRCGINKILLPDGCDVDAALKLIKPYSDYYQSSVLVPEPSFRRVERGSNA
ncbi:MAG: DUF934 domain-containing protein [Pseudomonadales bacterium]